MARKVINIRYEGEEADIAAAIDALAFYGQYNPTGTATKEEVAQEYLTAFIRARVKTFVPMIATQADRNALKDKEIAAAAAADATLNNIVKLPIEITDAVTTAEIVDESI
jgi:hypothetical protein